MEVNQALDQLAAEPAAPLDVAELALHLARDEYPQVDVEAGLSELAAMAHEARRYIRGHLEVRVAGLCRYLFHDMGFRGNTREYYDPRNSYLNEVLERRTGIPLTLSLVTIAVGMRAGLPVAGVSLPGHFIVRAAEGCRTVLFDPFHGGRQLTRSDCENLVRQVTGLSFRATPEAFEPVPPKLMVVRMLSNLKAIYVGQEDFVRAVRVIERLRQLDPCDPVQRRDLGVSLLRAGQPGRAIDHLAAYLSATPQGTDHETIRRLLGQARGEVAQWN